MAKKKTGRKKIPTALRIVGGNAGNRPLPTNEPKPKRVYKPKAPEGFDTIHTAKWASMVKKLSACRVLTELDLDALEIYVRNWVAMHESLTDLAARGKLLRIPGSGPMWNPSWSHYKHAEGVCRSLMAEFGMTPSSRTNVTADAGDDGKTLWN